MFAATLIGRRYILHQEIGRGAMGVVYRATDRLSGQIVALKQVTTTYTRDPYATQVDEGAGTAGADFRLALAQEFQMLSSLRHPNIISVLDYGFDALRQPYFTMDYLENARKFLEAAQNQPLPRQIDLLEQMLQAIAYLHRRGILHRDLKPANVLVKDGLLKVLDFGLAIAKEHTQDAPVAGTLLYLAPESLQGAPPSPSADLYAVGMMAYELLAGAHPFAHNDVHAMIQDILQAEPDVEALDTLAEVQEFIARLIAKTPHLRYQSAAEALAALRHITLDGRSTQTIESAAIRESFLQAAQFIGRAAERDTLGSALSAMTLGQGSAWLVGGESGVGKSRLLDELRTLGLVKGAFVLRGENVSGGGRPYEMWRDVLRRLCLQTDLLAGEAAVLRELVPDIAHLIERDVPDAPELEPHAAQQRLLNVIGSVFRHQAYPLLLILEDLQWAGGESLDVLRLLVNVPDLPLMIVASYRDDESPDLPAQLAGMRPLKLERLTADEIIALSESMLGEAGRRERVVRFLERETEGNVFFMVEVVRVLAEEAGNMDAVGLKSLPPTVFAGGIQRVVRRRLDRVPQAAMPLLEAAAVAGRELDLPLLRALPDGGETALDLEKWLVTCAESALLAVQHERWSFAHDKLREGLLADMPPQRKRALHRQIAQAIEQVYAGDTTQAALLAYHWAAVGEARKIALYAALAGAQSMRIGAGAPAKAFFEQALAAFSALPDTAEHRRQLIEITLNLSRLGLYFASSDFPNVLARALALAEEQGDEDLLARLYGAAGTFYYTRGQIGQGLRYFNLCIPLAEKRGIEKLLVMPYNNVGRAVMVSGDLPKAEAMLARGIQLAEKFNDLELLSGSLAWYAYTQSLQGRRAEAMPHVERAITLSQQLKDRAHEATALLVQGTIDYHCGRPEAALPFIEAARAAAEAINSEIQLVNILGTLGCVQLLLRDISAAAHHLDEALALAQKWNAAIGLPDFIVRRAEIDLLQDQPEQARARAQQALALCESTRQTGIRLLVLRVLGKIYAAQPQPDVATASALIEQSIALAAAGHVQVFMAISRLDLARIYAAHGRGDEARALLALAVPLFEQVDMPYYLAQARETLAGL
ncbi:MAG: protein kinase [Chloroflexi bacterium]|nr:protein kinase [Chloroflexota bacterium]